MGRTTLVFFLTLSAVFTAAPLRAQSVTAGNFSRVQALIKPQPGEGLWREPSCIGTAKVAPQT